METYVPQNLYRNVQGSFIHISKKTQMSSFGVLRLYLPVAKLGLPQTPSNVQMDKQLRIYTYNGALLANENDTHNHMDDSQKHCASAMAPERRK